MVATSYPRFPGDGVGSFMEPIAKSVAALGHEVHMVAPWHPAITRGRVEDGVFFHFFKYAPVASLNVFGYAGGLRADTDVRATAWAVAPAAVAAGWFKAWRVAHKRRATVMHGHWVIPGGVIAAGVNLALDALHAGTAQLPRIKVARPARVIGTGTVAAMESGIYWGYVGMVEGIVARIRAEYGNQPFTVIATGGLAALFAEGTGVIDATDPELTLRGIALVHQINRPQ